MLTMVESSVQFLRTLPPRFREFGSTEDSSNVDLHQVQTFLYMFSSLMKDYFTHDRKHLQSLAGSSVTKSATALVPDKGRYVQPDRYTLKSTDHADGKSSVLVETLNDCSALKHLLAFAYIWGFGSSLLDRYWIIIVMSVFSLIRNQNCTDFLEINDFN